MYGVTLIELLVVMVIVAVLVAAVLPILKGGFQAYFSGRDIMSTDTQVRPAMERIARELRQIRSSATGDLIIAPATQITFSDVNSSSVAFSMAAGTLYRNGQPLSDRIGALTFSYLQSGALAAATSANNVSYVTVQLTAVADSTSVVYRTTVRPLNLW